MAKKDISKRIVSMSLDIKLTERLKKVAENEGRSVSYIVEQCVAEYLPILEQEEILLPVKANESIEQMLGTIAGGSTADWLQQMGLRPTSIRYDGKEVSIGLGAVVSEDKDAPLKDIDAKITIIEGDAVDMDPDIARCIDWSKM